MATKSTVLHQSLIACYIGCQLLSCTRYGNWRRVACHCVELLAVAAYTQHIHDAICSFRLRVNCPRDRSIRDVTITLFAGVATSTTSFSWWVGGWLVLGAKNVFTSLQFPSRYRQFCCSMTKLRSVVTNAPAVCYILLMVLAPAACIRMSLCGWSWWLAGRRFDVGFDPLSRRGAPAFSLPHSGTVKAIRLLLFIVIAGGAVQW